MALLMKEFYIQQYEIKSRNRKKYVDEFLQNTPIELQKEAFDALSLLVNGYASIKDSNEVNVVSSILQKTEDTYIRSRISDLNHYLRLYTWKPEQQEIKQHVESLCHLYSSSLAQPLLEKPASVSNSASC